MPNETHTDYDSPWKDVLETYFEAFMRFFFPKAAADIRAYIDLTVERF